MQIFKSNQLPNQQYITSDTILFAHSLHRSIINAILLRQTRIQNAASNAASYSTSTADQTSDQRSDSDEFVESEEASDSDEMEFPAPNIETSSESESEDTVDSTYYPSISDTLTVRYLLQWKVAAGGIPPEIVDMIIEAAEYWASTEARIDGKIVIRQDGDRELLRTAPLYHEKVCVASFYLSF